MRVRDIDSSSTNETRLSLVQDSIAAASQVQLRFCNVTYQNKVLACNELSNRALRVTSPRPP